MLEPLNFATSYIPTAATAATRLADVLSIDSDNIPAPTADYTVSAKVDVLGETGGNQVLYFVVGESFRAIKAVNFSNTQLLHAGGALNVAAGTVGESHKIAATVDHSGNLMTLYRDEVSATGSPGIPTGTKTSITIGSEGAGAHLYGHISDFRIYDVALTAEQVAEL